MKAVVVGNGMIAKVHRQALALLPGIVASEAVVTNLAQLEQELDNGAQLCLVASPSGAHDEAILACAQRKIPVLVEKPLTITMERAKKLDDACRATNTPLGCIFQTRWSDDFRHAQEVIASGQLGRITYAEVQIPWWRDDSYYTSSKWHGTFAQDGGGALINQAIHMVDWLCALMPPVIDVKAFAATLAHPMEAEDTLTASLKFANGALGHIYAATSSFPGRSKSLIITGTKGTLTLDDTTAHGTSSPSAGISPSLHAACFQSFLDHLAGRATYPILIDEALKSLSLISKIYTSARK